MAQSSTKLCPACRKVRIMQDVDVCAACSNRGRGAQSNGDSVTFDGDLYYNENIKQIGDLGVFIDEVDKLAKLAEVGRINDMRRELVNFVIKDRKQHELDAEERVRSLVLGHIQNGMPLENLKSVQFRELERLKVERESL